MGTTVSIGQAIGAGDRKQAAKDVGNTVTLFMAVSITLIAVLLVLVRPIVSAMSTPTEAVDGTVAYLTICFIGIPFITAYNIISSIFRGMGDSKSPMYFIAVACAANIGLDYLFMGILRLGPAGAALGTTLSQAISVAVSLPIIVITIIANQRELNDAAAVVRFGGQYLRGYIFDCIFAGVHFSFSGYFCACGKSGLSFLHNILAIVLVRIPGVYLASKLFPATLFPMGLATAAGSLLSVVICIIAFAVIRRKDRKPVLVE